MAPKDYSRPKIFWTKHAIVEALEDGFRTEEVEKGMRHLVELPGFEAKKVRGVVKVGEQHCTLVFMRMKAGLRIITCWASSPSDIKDYERLSKK